MAPKSKKGPPPPGQRSITGFLLGGARSGQAATGSAPPPQPPPASPAGAASAAAPAPRPAKRQRAAEEGLPGSSSSAAGTAGTAGAASPAAGAAAGQLGTRRPLSAASNGSALGSARRANLQQKLGLELALGRGQRQGQGGLADGSSAGAGPQAAGEGAAGSAAGLPAAAARQALIEPPYVTDPSRHVSAKERAQLTPLEQQVVDLKRANPGVLLVVEVGYKMRFFGADAEIAARELGIYAYQDRAFLTAGVPVPRLHVHVRRLVQAGHKVGVVRQVETAAIKRAGDNRSGPFERRLVALYTRSTLEAGELGGLSDSDGEEDGGKAEGPAGPPTGSAARGALTAGTGTPGRRQLAASSEGHSRGEQPASSYLVCIVEQPASSSRGSGGAGASGGPALHAVDIGLVAVEPSTGAVLYAQFRDGLMRQELESRLLFASPTELLLAEPASAETRRLCQHIGGESGGGGGGGAFPRLETVPAEKYNGGGSSALSAVLAFYGGGTGGRGSTGGSDPACGSGSPGAAAAAEPSGGPPPSAASQEAALQAVRSLPPLVVWALAHLLDYLRPFGLQGVLRLGASFQPLDQASEMRLSANTLRQLEIFANTWDGSKRGSLLSILDRTLTPMGRRLLRRWVGKPLRQRERIVARLDAVQELAEQGSSHPVLSRLGPALKRLASRQGGGGGDLERGITRAFHGTTRPAEFAALLQTLSRLHEQLGLEGDLEAAAAAAAKGGGEGGGAGGMEGMVPSTANGRAGGEERGGVGGALHAAAPPPVALPGVESALLQQLLRAAGDLRVAAAARQLLGSMDLKAAEAGDRLNVLKDSDAFPEVQRWRRQLAGTEGELASLLRQFRQKLQISSLQYLSLQNLGEYLLEVPADLVGRVPKDWEKVNSVKRGVRFRPPEVKEALQRLELAREHLQAACAAAWRQFLSSFAELYLPFRAAVQALAALDCLCSLASLASSPGYCRPEMLGSEAAPQLHIQAGRHPVVELLLEGQEGGAAQFVPNDLHLQGDGRRCAIITGPNMGGKSCFVRQCALIAIMAQVGSFVPAASARLTCLDGVFTRQGAADNLALGRSTFAEELGEASAILAGATSSSLVILDELGRGTSTGDGAAIAEACLRHMVAGPGAHPLTLFITHYPEVCFRLQGALPQAVTCYRMAHAEVEDEEDGPSGGTTAAAAQQQQQPPQPGQHPTQSVPAPAPAPSPLGHIVFLFKLVEGVAPASFGLNVARMAQLPPAVIHRAAEVASRVQAASEQRRGASAGQGQQQKGEQQAAVAAAGPMAGTGVAGGMQAGAGASGSSGSNTAELLLLAQQCRQFLGDVLVQGRGRVDVEAGRRLQQRARELLAASVG